MSGADQRPLSLEKQQEKRGLDLSSYLGMIPFWGKRRRETSGTSVQSMLETPSPMNSERGFSEDSTECNGTVVSDFGASTEHERVREYPRKQKDTQDAQALSSELAEQEHANPSRKSLPVDVAAPAATTTSRQLRLRKGLRLHLAAPTLDPEEELDRAALETVIAKTCTRQLRIEGLSTKVDPSQLEKLGRLGSGSFGYVELMICTSGPHKGRTMAVKKVARHCRERWSLRKDLSYTKANQYEHVITYYGSIATTDEVWLCTEPLDFSLRALTNLGRIEEKFVAHITLCMIRGLHHLSTLNHRIIHRDIHPDNVLLSFGGCVKLIDFGLSADLVHTTRCSGTSHTGKTQYLAPECRTSPPRFGIRSDVWAVGVTANEAATGSRPFDDELTYFANPAKPLNEYLSRDCSSKFNDFVTACLAIPFEHRPLYSELMAMSLLVDAAQNFRSTSRDFALWLQGLRNAGLLGYRSN